MFNVNMTINICNINTYIIFNIMFNIQKAISVNSISITSINISNIMLNTNIVNNVDIMLNITIITINMSVSHCPELSISPPPGVPWEAFGALRDVR